MRVVRLVSGAFDPHAVLEVFSSGLIEAGAIVSFLGLVRGDSDGAAVEALELSHYEPMTLAGMEALADEAERRWKLDGLLIAHRVGRLAPRDPIVLVAAAARHRRDAFAAADFTMDHLKSEAWLWKRERTAAGWHWVEPRAEDQVDIARWNLT